MKKYKHLSYDELVKIETLKNENYSEKEIAIIISRDKTTIYRCIKKYSVNDEFIASTAYEKIRERKLQNSKPRRILSDSLLEKYIVEKIEEYWSPEQIANKWKHIHNEALSHETIYQYVYTHKPDMVKVFFARKGKKYQKDRRSKHQILNRRMIDERPDRVELREDVGHWEGDTIIGKNHKGAIVTNVERKTGLLVASKIPNKTAQAVLDATKDDFNDLPNELCVSITYDNGKEFSYHEMIEKQTGMTVYFARAYSPWERGTNENTNGLLRRFIPKGTDFDTVSEEDLAKYVDKINNRPRKRLGWLSPNEMIQNEINSVALRGGI